jgi:hypothetical protein
MTVLKHIHIGEHKAVSHNRKTLEYDSNARHEVQISTTTAATFSLNLRK